MGHRGGYNGGQVGVFPPPQAGAAPLDPQGFPGFAYLLGPPSTAQRTTLGASPVQARIILQALYNMLPNGVAEDNAAIPSGYTYLLQFIAHDLVDTTTPFWVAAEAGLPSRNLRDAALTLDTLYGGGPTVCPLAFEPNGVMPDYSTKLRLGQIADAATMQLAGACPMRDIPRLKLNAPPPAPSNVTDPSAVFLADERNDDNTIVSQICVLFSILHNAIAGKLSGLGPQACFAHASTALLTMYYSVIRQDLMRRLLHPAVYAELNNRAANSLDWLWDGQRIPLEFTHGAFRVGHAMVRPNYQFNTANNFMIAEVLTGPNVGDLIPDPLPASWIVEWSRFFDGLGNTPNYCLKLDIHQQLPVDFREDVFTPIAANSPAQLTVRDWLSAANARTWRLDALLTAISPHYPGLTFLDAAGIRAWIDGLLQEVPAGSGDGATLRAATDLLTTDLPLPLYVLLEARNDPANLGSHMGPLGSIVVGEVIFHLLAQRSVALAGLTPLAQQALGADWARITAVASMPDLIRLAADWGGLTGCPNLPFIA